MYQCNAIVDAGVKLFFPVSKSKVSVLPGPDSIMMSFVINTLLFERLFLGIYAI